MKISAPIPHILSVLAIKFKNEEDSAKCIDMLSEIETSEVDTNSRVLNNSFNTFMKSLHNEEAVAYRTSAFASNYFSIIGERELAGMYSKLLNELFTEKPVSPFYAGYIAGLFTSAIMNDLGLNEIVYNKKSLPESVEAAIKYIESEGFLVNVK